MVNAGRHPAGLEQPWQRQEQRTPCPLSLLPRLKQQQEQHSLCPLSLLPIDLLGQVFPAPDVEGARKDPNRLAARAACRWLRDAFDSCNTHLELAGAAEAGAKGKTQRRSYRALLQRLIARTTSLSSLHIKDWDNSRKLPKLHVPWGRLKKLDLSGWPCADWQPDTASATLMLQTCGLLARCSALEELVIFSGCLFVGKPGTLPLCSALQSLHLLEPSNSHLSGIALLFTALKKLVLEGCENDELDLDSIAACRDLRQLSLEDVSCNMSSLTSLTQLSSLHLRACWDDEVLQPIALLSSLRHLELEEANGITDISPLGSLRSSLERLIISGDNYIEASSLGPCLSSCTLLRHLDLSGCCEDKDVYEEGDTLDLSALSACILLEHLDLSNCPVSGSLEALLPCTRLQRLILDGCRVTALAPLVSLVELHLSYCNELRELSPLTACISLRTLWVYQCPRVKSLAPLAACLQLRELRLFECGKMASLKQIAACTQLTHLHISKCSGIKSLVPLSAQNNRALKQLRWDQPQLCQCGNLASLGPLVARTTLKLLNLKYMTNPIDLAPLVACQRLRELYYYGCCSLMNLAPLRSCSHLQKLSLASPLYETALRSLSHLKNLSIINDF